jgi:amidase
MNDLWRLTATEAVAKLRKRELSPLELVEAAASRIETVEPKINALPIRFLDEAHDQAKRFRRESRDSPGWLAGLPMAKRRAGRALKRYETKRLYSLWSANAGQDR